MSDVTEVDWLVVGSGAGGMTSAIAAADAGADVLVIEKSDVYGGTTALSGGVIWIPANHLMLAEGIDDSSEEGLSYLEQVTKGEVKRERLLAYVRRAPEMLRYMEQHADIRYESATQYMDYYPELPGGKQGGRSLDPAPFSRRRLGKIADQQRAPTLGRVLNRFSLTAREAHKILEMNLGTYWFLARRLLMFYLDIPSRLRGLPDNRMTLGQALVGRLRKALLDRDVPLWLNTRVRELVIENGRVSGAQVERNGRLEQIRARKGVLLAAGGMEHNTEMRRRHQAKFLQGEWSAASPSNIGEGIRLGEAAGGTLEFMECAWWTPTLRLPDGTSVALISGKSMPGSLFVNQAGRRFVNEAAPYEDVVKAQIRCHENDEAAVPCYMIFDARFRRSYPAGIIGPSKAQPDHLIPADLREAGFLKKGNTLRELAGQLGIDGATLEQTVKRFNEYARLGQDPDFHRGESLHDRYYADPRVEPNPSLAALDEAPFYALTLYPGDLGTKGGLACDGWGRVLDRQGQAIPGLYATGNCSSPVMGNSYPGAGATIGPAMTFGYLAARAAMGLEAVNEREERDERLAVSV